MDLLKTRLTRPILNSNFMVRERILSLMDRNKSKALTLVVAGAGYGKSIIVSQWLNRLEQKSCWIELGEDCNEFKTFVRYIVRAVKSVFPESLNESSNMTKSEEVNSGKIISETLIGELHEIGEELYIVFDDYQFIHNNEIHGLVEMILKYLSGRINLVVISRNDPPLETKHLIAYDNICEIRGKHLRFTFDEISQLSKQLYSDKLNDEQLKSVLYSTEGWIIAVRLQLKVLSEAVDLAESLEELEDKQESLMEYIFHKLITVEQDDIYKGLLLASFPERFTIDLIVRMMESDSTNIAFNPDLFRKRFEDTINKSMFVFVLDYDKKWFRFHRLVRDLLQKKVQQRYSNNQIKNFYIEASRYLESIQSYEEALHTALNGDDLNFAISIILGNYDALLDAEHYQRLSTWLNMLPIGTIEPHPELLMLRAALNEVRNNLIGLSGDLEILGKIIVPVDKNTTDGKRVWRGYYAFSAASLFYSRKYERALEMADNAIALLDDNFSHFYTAMIIVRSMAMQFTGKGDEATKLTDKFLTLIPAENKLALIRTHLSLIIVKSIQGKINEIFVSGNLVKELCRERNKWMTYGMANYYLAAANYYTNKLDEVYSIYQDSRKHGFAGRPHNILHTGFYAAQQMLAIQDYQGFQNIITELHDYTGKLNNSKFRNLCAAFELDCELRHGTPEKTRELAANVDFSDYPSAFFFFYTPALTKIKLRLANIDNWDIEETRIELEELIKQNEQINTIHILVQAYPLLAIWHFRFGEKKEALSYLRKAIDMTEEGGFVRIFLDLGKEMYTLIEALDPKEKRQPFVDKILNSFNFNFGRNIQLPNYEPIKKDKANTASVVTPKEIEILKLIVKGYANKEIAELLFLSLGTVKTYIYNIYQKIEVKNRVEAIVRCQELGLVDVFENLGTGNS